VPNQPHFDALELKGGGEALGAARAVLQTGEFDFAWNLAAEDEILKRLEATGKGKLVFLEGSDIEFVSLQVTDPWNEVDGERASVKSKHPVFSDKAVRQAMALLVDRKGVQEFIYGRGAIATANFLNNPPRFRSPNMKFEFNIDKANQILEAAGWKKGADGIRAKGNQKLKFVFQTSVSQPRQKCQAIIKDACTKAGIDLELKSVTAAVFFGSDAANPDTYQKFWTDIQMYTTTMTQPDPQIFMEQFTTGQIAQKANKWASRNLVRWSNAEYDATFAAAQVEFDPVKRAAMFIKMNDLLISDGHVIPLFARPRPRGYASSCGRHFRPGTAICGPWATGSRKHRRPPPGAPEGAPPSRGAPPAARQSRFRGGCLMRFDPPVTCLTRRFPSTSFSLVQLHPPPPADCAAQLAGHQPGAVHRAGAGAGRSF
jgi:peptide/nickel transport system substrate-binding protein